MVLLMQGRVEAAGQHFLAALAIAPAYARAHDGLGVVRLQQGKIDEALSHLQGSGQTGSGHRGRAASSRHGAPSRGTTGRRDPALSSRAPDRSEPGGVRQELAEVQSELQREARGGR